MRVIVAGVGYRNLRDHSVGVVVADRLLERAVMVAAVERGNRPPGAVTAYSWDGVLPDDEEVQRAVTEAVTGVIALDNTLVVTRHFGGLPDEVVVIEVEPAVQEFGEDFSEPVSRVIDHVCELAVTMATDASAMARLPRRSLGGLPIATGHSLA